MENALLLPSSFAWHELSTTLAVCNSLHHFWRLVMQLTEPQKRVIQRVVNVFETGSPEGDYATISIYKDGPHDIRQITYGRSQTTEYGNLRQLVEQYVAAGGMFSQQLRSYADRVGSTPLTDDTNFKNLLRSAGKHDPVMKRLKLIL